MIYRNSFFPVLVWNCWCFFFPGFSWFGGETGCTGALKNWYRDGYFLFWCQFRASVLSGYHISRSVAQFSWYTSTRSPNWKVLFWFRPGTTGGFLHVVEIVALPFTGISVFIFIWRNTKCYLSGFCMFLSYWYINNNMLFLSLC